MTENTADGFQHEGAPAFPTAESTAETTAADSQPGEENQGGDTPTTPGANKAPDDTTPFHEHPRWKERETEWNTKFNDQELRHQSDIADIRKEFGTARKDNAEAVKIPAWFGGDQAQWDAYRADRDQELKQAEDAAYTRLKTEASTGAKAVEDATAWLNAEASAIEGDTTLNPSGAKVDLEKLFKAAYDNQLVDPKGRWNYRAAWKILNGTTPAPAPKPNTAKKQDAAATTSETRAETKPEPFKTSADFKKKRPW